MRKLALVSTLLLIPLALAAAALSARPKAIPGTSGTVWVVERLDGATNTLAAFDASSGEVLGVVPVGRRPIGVVAPRGTGKVYSADERSNQLSVLSKDSFTIVKRIPMGTFPHHLMAGPGGDLVYVGQYGTNTIGVVDTSLDEKIADWPASTNPLARTHAVWISNNGKELYATNEGSTQASVGTLSKLNARTGELIWEHSIGARPSEVLVTANRKLAYVSIRNENKVKVLDVSGDEPVQIGETVVGTMPDTLQLTNDGKTLVVGLRGTPQMALMDTETFAVRHVTFPGYGISGHEWLSANGKYTFIALEALVTTQPGAIAVVDNDSAEIVDTWPYPGGPWPHGVFYEPEVLR